MSTVAESHTREPYALRRMSGVTGVINVDITGKFVAQVKIDEVDYACSDTSPVTSDERQENSVEAVPMFVGALNSHSTAWRVDLQLLGADVSFKIDTGADVSVIPESLFQSLPHKPPLQPCQHALVSAANTNLETVRQFAAENCSVTMGTTSTCSILCSS